MRLCGAGIQITLTCGYMISCGSITSPQEMILQAGSQFLLSDALVPLA
jgi:hypothetical protein